MAHLKKLPSGHLGKNSVGHLTNNCLVAVCCPTECFDGGGLCGGGGVMVEISGFTDTCCVWMNGIWDLSTDIPDCNWVTFLADPAPSFASGEINLTCADDVWTFVLAMYSGPFDIGCSAAQESYEGSITACGNACGCGTYTMARTGGGSCPSDDPITVKVCV